MTHGFKTRRGVKTCDPCGRDEEGRCASSGTTQPACSDARCPWKDPDGTPEAMSARVAELESKFNVFGYGPGIWR